VQGEQVRSLQSEKCPCVLIIASFHRRYILRDFQFSADQIEKELEELQTADTAEKELWVGDLLLHLLDLTLTLLHLDGASPALGNKLFRSLSSFRALEGSTSIRGERVTVRSSRKLRWNSGQSEWPFTCLTRSLTRLLVFIARAENHQTHAHGVATTSFLSLGALAGTCQVEERRLYQRGFCRRVSVTT
jgi:hypothetical protein